MHLISVEKLAHFQCGNCKGWWSIGDAPSRDFWYCPWCGEKAKGTNMVYTYGLRVKGELQSSYAFNSQQEVDRWKREDYPLLVAKYGKLETTEFTLPGLQVGDRCKVSGDGNKIYTIKELMLFSPDRPGFILNNGAAEEVVKCRSLSDE